MSLQLAIAPIAGKDPAVSARTPEAPADPGDRSQAEAEGFEESLSALASAQAPAIEAEGESVDPAATLALAAPMTPIAIDSQAVPPSVEAEAAGTPALVPTAQAAVADGDAESLSQAAPEADATPAATQGRSSDAQGTAADRPAPLPTSPPAPSAETAGRAEAASAPALPAAQAAAATVQPPAVASGVSTLAEPLVTPAGNARQEVADAADARFARVEAADGDATRAPAAPAASPEPAPRPAAMPAAPDGVALAPAGDAAATEASASLRVEGAAGGLRSEGAAATSASAPPSGPAPATPPAVQQTIAALVQRADGETELRLDPPELGRVRLSLTTTEAGLVATVVADRPEVADMMRRHADALVRSLESAGHANVDLRFSSGERQAGGDNRGQTGADAPAFGKESVAAADVPVAWVRADGLDLRV